MADPVSGPLVGRPDNNANPTNVLRDFHTFYLSPDAAGYAVCVIGNCTLAAHVPMPVVTGLITVGTGVNAPNHTSFTTEFNRVRFLAAHVKVEYVGAAQVAAGRLSLTTNSAPTSINGLAPEALFDDVGVRGPLQDGGQMILRPFDSAFGVPTSSTYPSQCLMGVITICGAPTGTNTVMVTVTRVLEGIPNASSLHSATATHTISNPLDLAAADNVQGNTATFQAGPGNAMVRHGTTIVETLAEAYGTYQAALPLIETLSGLFI